jgi:hypothetical protein
VPSLVWASVFLLLVLLGSVIGCFGMIGMPISVEMQVGLYGAGLLLAGFGWLLLAASSPDDSRAAASSAFNH